MSEYDAKRAARRRARAAREALGEDARALASARIRSHLASSPELRGARAIAAYAATDAEVDLDPLLDVLLERGVAVHLPVVEGAELVTARVHHLADDLDTGYRGVREPRPDLPREPAPAVDAVLVPGLAFSPEGGRAGYGGGHFDRLLARIEGALRIGVAFGAQVLDDVPVGPHDVSMDMLVTEEGILRL